MEPKCFSDSYNPSNNGYLTCPLLYLCLPDPAVVAALFLFTGLLTNILLIISVLRNCKPNRRCRCSVLECLLGLLSISNIQLILVTLIVQLILVSNDGLQISCLAFSCFHIVSFGSAELLTCILAFQVVNGEPRNKLLSYRGTPICELIFNRSCFCLFWLATYVVGMVTVLVFAGLFFLIWPIILLTAISAVILLPTLYLMAALVRKCCKQTQHSGLNSSIPIRELSIHPVRPVTVKTIFKQWIPLQVINIFQYSLLIPCVIFDYEYGFFEYNGLLISAIVMAYLFAFIIKPLYCSMKTKEIKLLRTCRIFCKCLLSLKRNCVRNNVANLRNNEETALLIAPNDSLYEACRQGNLSTVKSLLHTEDLVSLNCTSKDRDDKWRRRKTALMLASEVGSERIVEALIEAGADVNKEADGTALEYACFNGHFQVVRLLLSKGGDPNGNGSGIPLMEAARHGHDDIVRELILRGANPHLTDPVYGCSALHWAAIEQKSKSCEYLVKAGASLDLLDRSGNTPLYYATAWLKNEMKQVASLNNHKLVAVIGNSCHGKSTLVAALQRESRSFYWGFFKCGAFIIEHVNCLVENSFIKWFDLMIEPYCGYFTRVDDITERTAGIESIPFQSKFYGRVLFYDFAGQEQYHGPHQPFLEALLGRPGVTLTLLLLVKSTDREEVIFDQMTQWLQQVIQQASDILRDSTVQVVPIGSYGNQLKNRAEMTEALEKIKRCSERLDRPIWMELKKPCILDCRYIMSHGIEHIQQCIRDVNIEESVIFDQYRYNLIWVISQLRSSLGDAALRMGQFKSWMIDNKEVLPYNLPSADQVCRDLSASGHALYLPNRRAPAESWLVLDLTRVLSTVYGRLFEQFIEPNEDFPTLKFGIIQREVIDQLFSQIDFEMEMIHLLLINLEFCLEFDPSFLKKDILKLTSQTNETGWLFFPSLIRQRNKPDDLFSEPLPSRVYSHFCWHLQATGQQFYSARLHQTIFLRLAANFVIKRSSTKEHCCVFWQNGIIWSTTLGIEVAVRISNRNVVQVMSRSLSAPDEQLASISEVTYLILQIVKELSPQMAVKAYAVQDESLFGKPNLSSESKLFPLEDVLQSVQSGRHFILPLAEDSSHPPPVPTDEVFGCHPSLVQLEKMLPSSSTLTGESI